MADTLREKTQSEARCMEQFAEWRKSHPAVTFEDVWCAATAALLEKLKGREMVEKLMRTLTGYENSELHNIPEGVVAYGNDKARAVIEALEKELI